MHLGRERRVLEQLEQFVLEDHRSLRHRHVAADLERALVGLRQVAAPRCRSRAGSGPCSRLSPLRLDRLLLRLGVEGEEVARRGSVDPLQHGEAQRACVFASPSTLLASASSVRALSRYISARKRGRRICAAQSALAKRRSPRARLRRGISCGSRSPSPRRRSRAAPRPAPRRGTPMPASDCQTSPSSPPGAPPTASERTERICARLQRRRRRGSAASFLFAMQALSCARSDGRRRTTMYLVAIAWLYVVVLMALAEGFAGRRQLARRVLSRSCSTACCRVDRPVRVGTPARRAAAPPRPPPQRRTIQTAARHAAGDAVAPEREEP